MVRSKYKEPLRWPAVVMGLYSGAVAISILLVRDQFPRSVLGRTLASLWSAALAVVVLLAIGAVVMTMLKLYIERRARAKRINSP